MAAHFPRYRDFDPLVAVYCATPDLPGCIHRFYDTSPFSPSGRYLALTRLPDERRPPRPGDLAQVVVVDLRTGATRAVAETRGWDAQLGAQVQWGQDDRSLFFNDVDTRSWSPFGVVIDPDTGAKRRLDGPVYMISPDGAWSASPCLLRMARTQAGYGVVVPPDAIPANPALAADDGVYLTDTATGRSRLLVSIAQIAQALAPALGQNQDGAFYGFHTKWNLQGTRLLFVLRWVPATSRWPWGKGHSRVRKYAVTMDARGGDIRLAVPDAMWGRGGNHPNWCPDGEHLLMNLDIRGDGPRFVRVRYDGSRYETLAPSIPGSGHPTMHPDGRHILTDAYLRETATHWDDGTAPLRWIDWRAGAEKTLVRIRTRPDCAGPAGVLRVDPHPAWDRGFRRIAFNACPDGRRQVFVAELREHLGDA